MYQHSTYSRPRREIERVCLKSFEEILFEEIIVKNFPNMEKQTVTQVQEVQRVPYRINLSRKIKVLVAQSCPTLFDPMDCSLAGSSVHGIFQASILEQVAIPFSRGSSQPRGQTQVCCIVNNSLSSEPRRNMLRCKLIKLKKIEYK